MQIHGDTVIVEAGDLATPTKLGAVLAHASEGKGLTWGPFGMSFDVKARHTRIVYLGQLRAFNKDIGFVLKLLQEARVPKIALERLAPYEVPVEPEHVLERGYDAPADEQPALGFDPFAGVVEEPALAEAPAEGVDPFAATEHAEPLPEPLEEEGTPAPTELPAAVDDATDVNGTDPKQRKARK